MLDLLPLASCLFCAGIAVLSLVGRRGRPGATAFCLGMASLALMELANFLAIRATAVERIILWKQLSLAAEILVAGNWLLFGVLFAKEDVKGVLKKWVWALALAYVVPGSLLLLLFSQGQMVLTDNLQTIKLGAVAKYFHISLLLIIVLAVVNLENTFRSASIPDRWQIKNTFFGLGAILVFCIYVLSQRLLYHVIDLNNIYLMSGAIVISNTVIIYAFIRNKIVVGDIYVSRNVLYNSISLFTIGIYILLVGIVGQLIKSFGISTTIKVNILFVFAALLALVVIFSKDTIKRSFKGAVNKHFRKGKYDYREEWALFSSALSKKIHMGEVIDSLLQILSERMFLRTVSLWLVDESRSKLYMAGSRNIDRLPSEINLDDKVLSYLYEKESPLSHDELVNHKKLQPISKEISSFLRVTKAELLVPLIVGETPMGILTLGEIWSGESFDDQDDYDLLKSVAAHAASAINSARLFEEKMRARELEAFHRVSSFLMHDLKNATSMLSMVVQNARKHISNPKFQQDALKTISEAVVRMQKMIGGLSTFPHEYQLELKDLDLNELVNDAVEEISRNGFADVEIETDLRRVPRVRVDLEQMRKVVHNLFLNACEAANGNGHIKVSTNISGDQVIFSVNDNGPGMTREFMENSLFQPFKSTKGSGLGIGLYQCKSIVEAHHGRIEVESEQGKGTTFLVYLPVGGGRAGA